jgi:hypothetical protein
VKEATVAGWKMLAFEETGQPATARSMDETTPRGMPSRSRPALFRQAKDVEGLLARACWSCYWPHVQARRERHMAVCELKPCPVREGMRLAWLWWLFKRLATRVGELLDPSPAELSTPRRWGDVRVRPAQTSK